MHHHQTQSTERGGPPVSFKHRCSQTLDRIATKCNRQKGKGPPVSFEHPYSPTIDCITNKYNQQKGEGPQSASSIDILRPLIASSPNTIDRKGRSPSQLQALIFSDLRSHCYQMQSTEREGPPVSFASPTNAIERKGRAPSQLQASIFSDFRSHCHEMQSTEREGPPVSFEHQYSPTFDCITNKCNQ